MRTPRALASTSIAILVAALPRLAAASPSYPGDIKTDLGLTYDLGTTHCIICHASNAGGVGTVVKPFGVAITAAGLVLENPASLQAALDALQADKTDSDCDGTPDITQLEDGRDPNTGEYIDGSGKTAPPDPGCGTSTEMPAFGCGARIAPAPDTPPWQALAALATGLGLALTRRRR